MTKLRWGILGTGNIARQFAAGVNASNACVLQAVGSRSPDAAGDFAAHFPMPSQHLGYESLVNDPQVDAVYISLPNSLHHEWTIKALRAGKHVLCEKPFALDEAQAAEMFAVARRCGRVVMEAFMYRTHPLTLAVQQAIQSGAIGTLRLIRTSFCYRTTKISGNVRFDRRLGGGGLMDVGCYCISFSRLFAEAEPNQSVGCATMHAHGVDELFAGSMKFPGGVLASFACGMCAQADNTAYLCGSEGYIAVPVPWKPPAKSIFVIARGIPPKMDGKVAAMPTGNETRTVEVPGHLYGLEADAFALSVTAGVAPIVGEAETLGNMRVLDQLRKQTGIDFVP